MKTIPIALVGPGKIAVDQHFPSIEQSGRFALAAVISRRGVSHGDVPVFADLDSFLKASPDIPAIAFCTPPAGRHQAVAASLQAGKHVLVEKPPTTTLAELHDLENLARLSGQVLFGTWHCQFNPAVARVREILARDGVSAVDITWRESVWRWHPGQDWIWDIGGFGVFDPGINALSILTSVLPDPFFVRAARFDVPANRQMPIAASLTLATRAGVPVTAQFDWREQETETWDIDIVSGAGQRLRISRGGGELRIDNVLVISGPKQEYRAIYQRFAQLIDAGRSDVDAAPLRLVADAFMLAERVSVEPFDW
jgi:D-galactose 1-dehydrogenase